MTSSSGGQVSRRRRVLRLHAAVVVEVVIVEVVDAVAAVVAVDGVLTLSSLKDHLRVEVEQKFFMLVTVESD